LVNVAVSRKQATFLAKLLITASHWQHFTPHPTTMTLHCN